MKKMTLLLGGTIAIQILALVALCFFQFPSLDDYVASYLENRFGQPGINYWYLTHMNGRYTTIPIFFLVCSSRFLLSHYEIPLLFFMSITFFSFYYFIRIMSKQIFVKPASRLQSLMIAGVFFLVCVSIIPEIAGFLYWLPSVITYTIPFCLFLFYIITWSRFFQRSDPFRTKYVLLLCLLTLLLGGCNELMTYFAFGFPFLIAVSILLCRQSLPLKLWIVALTGMVMAVIVFKMPGNNIRANDFQQTQSWINSFTGSIFRTWQFFLLLFTNPLFYISGAAVFIISAQLNASVVQWHSRKLTSWLQELALLVLIFFAFDLVLRQFANYVVPERVTNIKVCIALLGFWWVILINGAGMKGTMARIRTFLPSLKIAWITIFIFGMIGAGFTRELITNLLVAPMHIEVVEGRVAAIEKAKAEGKRTVYIAPYEKDAEAVVQKRFGEKTRFVMTEFPMPPSFSFFKNEAFNLEHAYFYAEYYGIDSIATDTARYARWGLTDIVPNDQPVK